MDCFVCTQVASQWLHDFDCCSRRHGSRFLDCYSSRSYAASFLACLETMIEQSETAFLIVSVLVTLQFRQLWVSPK